MCSKRDLFGPSWPHILRTPCMHVLNVCMVLNDWKVMWKWICLVPATLRKGHIWKFVWYLPHYERVTYENLFGTCHITKGSHMKICLVPATLQKVHVWKFVWYLPHYERVTHENLFGTCHITKGSHMKICLVLATLQKGHTQNICLVPATLQKIHVWKFVWYLLHYKRVTHENLFGTCHITKGSHMKICLVPATLQKVRVWKFVLYLTHYEMFMYENLYGTCHITKGSHMKILNVCCVLVFISLSNGYETPNVLRGTGRNFIGHCSFWCCHVREVWICLRRNSDYRRIMQPCNEASGYGGLGVACWPLVPKFAGSNPTEAVGFLRAKNSSARLP